MDPTRSLPHVPSSPAAPAPSRPSGPRGGVPATSPAFEVLLERLTARAAELREKSQSVETPEELPAALDSARASLEEALQLGNELLEAYRSARTGAQESKP